jgi:hypothetical protein
MKLLVERKLTEIVTVCPYGGQEMLNSASFPTYVRNLVAGFKKHAPYVVFETIHEPAGTEDEKYWANRQIVDILLQEGIPPAHIMIAYVDRGVNTTMLANELQGRGTMSLHWTGTMATINMPYPDGGEGSDGTHDLMKLGLIGSSDGQDKALDAHGFNFWHHEQHGVTEYRRANNIELKEITRWMLDHGKGYEFLSSAAFQESEEPDLVMGYTIGGSEQKAMREAFDGM